MNKKIKKFKDFSEVKKYFNIEDFETTIEVESPTYGTYRMTKVLTIDMIKACEDDNLITSYDLYDKIAGMVKGSKSVILNSKSFGGTKLHKWEVYTPFKDDNKDWVDPKGYYKVGDLPIAYNKNVIYNRLTEVLK